MYHIDINGFLAFLIHFPSTIDSLFSLKGILFDGHSWSLSAIKVVEFLGNQFNEINGPADPPDLVSMQLK